MPRSSGFQIAALLLALAVCSPADAAEGGHVFNSTSKSYELKFPALGAAEEIRLDSCVHVDPHCAEGARLCDKWGPGSQEACRREVGTNGSLRFTTPAPQPTRAEYKLNRLSHIVAVFSPRQTIANLY